MTGAPTTAEDATPPRRALVIANPISGRGRGARAAEALVRAFARHAVTAEVRLTRARGEATRLVAGAPPGELVVAVGGDGTLSEVLLGLHAPVPPVGLFPTGTANVLAHELRLPVEPEAAVEAFLRGRTQGLDVARVGARLAHLVVSAGFDARVVHAVEARRRGPITKAAYLAALLRTLGRTRPVPLRVWLDDEELAERPAMVWVANTARYANLLRLAEDTRLDDGWWEVYLFRTARVPELLAAVVRGLVARLPGGAITLRRARRVRIEAPEPVPCQVDGDQGGSTPLAFELHKERFRILVP